MAAQPLENLVLLDAHCLPNMAPHIKRAVILEAAMFTHLEIARLEGVRPATVANWFTIASSEIGVCLPGNRGIDKPARGYWVGRHCGNCLADAVADLNGGR